MTPEEAKNRILGVHELGVDCDLMSKDEYEFHEVLLDALEKQIPKQPILDTIFPSGVKWWLCPVCRHNNIETNDKFCHECGQALDWSDDND